MIHVPDDPESNHIWKSIIWTHQLLSIYSSCPPQKDIYLPRVGASNSKPLMRCTRKVDMRLHRFQTRRFDPRSLSGEPPPLEGCQVNWNHRMLGVSFGLVGHLNLISGGHRVMAQQLLKSNRTTLKLHTSPGVKFKATHALRKHSCPPLQKNMTKCFILLHDMSFQ